MVSLTRWLPNLTDVMVPEPWRSEDGGLRPLRNAGGELTNLSQAELVDLVQRTDLILFDYLTANFDRLVCNSGTHALCTAVPATCTENQEGRWSFWDNEAAWCKATG